jgi:hypothetical protein
MVSVSADARTAVTELPDQPEPATATGIPRVGRRIRISPFWAHLLEMFVAMWIGMALGTPALRAALGLPTSAEQAYELYPWQSVLLMGVSMTVPMVAWMLLRGHGRRNAAEMAAAMLVPGVPFVLLCSVHVLAGRPAAGIYMALSIPAMLGLMWYRRVEYSMHMPPPWRRQASAERHGALH